MQVVVEAVPHVPDPVTGNASRATGNSAEPLQWGVYIPSDIFKLTCWLRAGAMAQEEPLLAALERAPLPQPEPGQPVSAAAWREVAVAAGAADQDGMLPDGYRGVLAPPLPGALIQPFTLPREDPPAAVHARRALHSAASALRFWAHSHPDAAPAARSSLLQLLLQLHGHSLQPSTAPRLAPPGAPPNPAAATEALRRDTAAVAEALTTAGAMGEPWLERRRRWSEMLASAQSTRDLIALISVLCLNVAWRREPAVMHRGSFHNFTATQHVPLFFPVPGDRVAILRSGLLANVQRIRDAVQSPPRWSGRDGSGVLRTSSSAGDGDACKGGAEAKVEADEDMMDVDGGAGLSAGEVKQEAGAGKDTDTLNGITAAAAGKTPSDFPPVPPPTPKQEAWLQEITEVEQVARTMRPVEMMSVAAVAYVPAEIPEAVQRCEAAPRVSYSTGGRAPAHCALSCLLRPSSCHCLVGVSVGTAGSCAQVSGSERHGCDRAPGRLSRPLGAAWGPQPPTGARAAGAGGSVSRGRRRRGCCCGAMRPLERRSAPRSCCPCTRTRRW